MGDNGNEFDEPSAEVPLATIALRQVRMNQAEMQDKARNNPMNRLVPYLDLFGRLSDEELARLASVPESAASNLRRQVIQVDRALERFADLLPRLTDAEMVRLTGATAKTVRFWRLCQPRVPVAHDRDDPWSVARAAEKLGQVSAATDLGPPSSDEPLDSGVPLSRRHESGEHGSLHATMAETPRAGRHPSGEIPGVPIPSRPEPSEITWSGYRMPAEERDAGPQQRRSPVDLSTPRPTTPPASTSSEFSRKVAEVAGARKGGQASPPPEVIEKHRAVSEQMAFSGAPFPGYDSEASGGHEDGIFIGLELPDPRTLAQPGRRDQD